MNDRDRVYRGGTTTDTGPISSATGQALPSSAEGELGGEGPFSDLRVDPTH
jgi:hypothetical protein